MVAPTGNHKKSSGEAHISGEAHMGKFTRRHFIKASVAAGIVAGTVAAPTVLSPFRRGVIATGATTAPLPNAISSLSSTFNLNGDRHTVEHEARTTLWEVISEKIGL